VATSGEGVFETLNMIARLVLHRFVKDASNTPAGKTRDIKLV
jgi:hypothetical protein